MIAPDVNGFVSRPSPKAGTILERLRATASNGQAILLKSPGGYIAQLRAEGFRVRTTRLGAPAGYVFAWMEPMASTPVAP